MVSVKCLNLHATRSFVVARWAQTARQRSARLLLVIAGMALELSIGKGQAKQQIPYFPVSYTHLLLRIQQISGNRLEIPQGSFYPALYRLEHQGWIEGEWGESENNRKAKFYRLTAAGKRRFKSETAKWTEMTDVVATILGATLAEP